MRTIPVLFTVAALSLSLAACKKDEKKDDKQAEPVKAPPANPKAEPATKPAPDTAAEAMAKRAGNCPSTVADSKTELTEATPEGRITLAISSDDAKAVATIRSRTKHLVEVQDATDAKIEHTGAGTGGGGIGLCPVVTQGTKVSFTEGDKGVTVTLEPSSPEVGAKLKAEVEARIAKSADWLAKNVKDAADPKGTIGGTGGGTGKHGANRSGKGDGSGVDPAAPASK